MTGRTGCPGWRKAALHCAKESGRSTHRGGGSAPLHQAGLMSSHCPDHRAKVTLVGKQIFLKKLRTR